MSDLTEREHAAAFAAAIGPEALAEIVARSDAMVETAAVYERALADQQTAIRDLLQTDDGLHLLTRMAGVIALEELRCAALGCGAPSWQEALSRYDVLSEATIKAIKPTFKREASSN